MGEKNNAKKVGTCPSCGGRGSYLARQCGLCGYRFTPLDILRIAGGLLASGTPMRSLRRQIAEVGCGMGNEMLAAAAQLFQEAAEPTSIVSMIVVRDFGDPRVISEEVLESRFPYASQALRVEIAQTLTAYQTETAGEIIEALKGIESDSFVKRAFEEPLLSSEGLSMSLETNLRGGRIWEGKESFKREVEDRSKAGDVVEAVAGARMRRAEKREGELGAEMLDLGDLGGPSQEEVVRKAGWTIPPPLPFKSVAGGGMAAPIAEGEVGVARGDTERRQRKSLLFLIFTLVAIGLLGATIGYVVLRYGRLEGGGKGEVAKVSAAKGDVVVGKGTEVEEKGPAEGVDEKRRATNEEGDSEKSRAPTIVSHIIAGKVSASSQHRRFPASNVADGNPATVWQEERGRKPLGEWIRIDFDKEVTVTRIGIVGGFDFVDKEGKDHFPLNCRLKEAEVSFSGGESVKLELSDKRAMQYFAVEPPRRSFWVRLTVFRVYRGSWFFDNAIGEIELWGYEEEDE